MTKLDWTLLCLIAALPTGCAGKLDSHEDFFGDRTSPALKSSAAGNGSAAAGSGGSKWQDSGTSNPSAQAGMTASPANPSSNAGSRAPSQAWGADDDYDAGSPTKEQPTAAGSGGSGGSAKADAGATMAAACDFKGIVQTKCGNPSCHGAPASNTGLDLTSTGLAMRLDGRKGAGACTDKLLVDKEHPEDSKLYLKVTGSTCGTKMPLGGSLTASEQACFLTWIEGL